MRLDNVRDAWQGDGGAAGSDPSAALARAQARAAALDADVRRRDRRETLVALVMAPLFLLMALAAHTTTATIGALIVVAACLYIPLRLRATRRATPTTAGLAVADALHAELQQVEAQQRLLGNATLWYFGPLGVGLALYIAGGPASPLSRALQVGALVALYAALAVWNVRVARRDVAPVAAALRQSIHELQVTDEDTEGAHDE